MASRTPGESGEHKRLIRMMVNHFTNQGYTGVRADLDGHTQPDSISDGRGNRYVPDLSCRKNDWSNTPIVLEAETCSSINDDHTVGQWRAFARAHGEFHLVVPKTCGTESGQVKARRRLRELGIAAKEVWTPQ